MRPTSSTPRALHAAPRHALVAFALAVVLAACAGPAPQTPPSRAGAVSAELPLDTPVPTPRPGELSNAALARDFRELSFALETGRALPVFTRFEGPVSISFAGAVPANAPAELDRLTARLRSEAGIAIGTGLGGANRITLEFVPKRVLQAEVPGAACFVVPNVAGWDDYRARRRDRATDWATQTVRRDATVFIPAEASPQELRDCLHEEVSQALGPLNDLYRLPDSIWNDDNFQAVLTRHDMLILRATYAPELSSGMTEAEVVARLPAVLARINPAGGAVTPLPADPTPQRFSRAIDTAFGTGTPARRKAAAAQAVAIARAEGWNDSRTGFALFALGRLSLKDDPQGALSAFRTAGAIFRATPGAAVQAAHVDMQLAALALASGQPGEARALSERALPPARTAENAALTATLSMIRAEACEALGDSAGAKAAWLDSQHWARYGFGSDAAVRARATEVAALAGAGAQVN
ncbi:DUF2927 domain-containing protein [Sinirhodobacter ferrireducens]|uniref:DUF2927 domain-containing protein n=1 Tax=Paenirhodobacter ferrireducens TaxID=1215032 RepID=A0A443LTH9_9RHOB|nr:DUF2927 domain-containing protein [Sinirhodobacter ferrireducens]RWR52478.1 DUF2927 domain-containing protein [Sinirhodobacter ferrireducens]